MAFPAPFFSSTHFYVKSPPYEYVSLNIKQRFFPKDSKTALGFEIGPLGTELWLFQHHFFQALIFMSNRHHTSTYHKISIKDFFPRIPKLPSDLKLVHWGPSYGSANILLYRLLYQAFTIYEKYLYLIHQSAVDFEALGSPFLSYSIAKHLYVE